MLEREFIGSLQNGSQEAFKRLVELYQVPLIRLCKGFLHKEEDARDIVQETFIEVFESVQQFRGEAKLSTWLYRIAVNKSLNYIRKNKINRLFIHPDLLHPLRQHVDQLPQPDNSPDQPGVLLEIREKTKKIRQGIVNEP